MLRPLLDEFRSASWPLCSWAAWPRAPRAQARPHRRTNPAATAPCRAVALPQVDQAVARVAVVPTVAGRRQVDKPISVPKDIPLEARYSSPTVRHGWTRVSLIRRQARSTSPAEWEVSAENPPDPSQLSDNSASTGIASTWLQSTPFFSASGSSSKTPALRITKWTS